MEFWRHGEILSKRTGPKSQLPCAVKDCFHEVAARGWCSGHYQRWQAYGDVQAEKPLQIQHSPRRKCNIPKCNRMSVGRGYCSTHHARLMRGNLQPNRPIRQVYRDGGPLCAVLDCGRKSGTARYCAMHARRVNKYGAPGPAGYQRAPHGKRRWIDGNGYIHVSSGDSRFGIMEHRLVMERKLGRQLFPDERVHHKNGDRANNQLDNLELWSNSHPPGQRVEDKVKWAKEILERYRDFK